jgi:hypothetical protein
MDFDKSFYHEHADRIDEWANLLNGSFANMVSASRVQFVNVQMLADNKKYLIAFVAEHADALIDVFIWDKVSAPPQMKENVLNNRFEFVFIFGGNSRTIPFADFHGDTENVFSLAPHNEMSDIHKAVFPVGLPMRFLEICCKAQSVLDLFGGTGTTMIAAQKLDRSCYMMEIDPTYCDVIRRRWAEFVHGEGCDWERLTPKVDK